MKNKFFPVSIYCILLFVTGTVSAAPKLSVSARMINFQTVTKGERVSEEITITNNGTDPLEIIRVRSSCSCVQTGLPPRIIPPRQSQTLTVWFDASLKEPGPGHYQLLISSTDPHQPVTTINVLALVEYEQAGLRIEPDALDFGTIQINESIPVLHITITNESSRPYSLLEIKAGRGVDIPSYPAETIPPFSDVDIPVTLHTWVTGGLLNSHVTIRTSDPHIPAFHCKVRGIVRK